MVDLSSTIPIYNYHPTTKDYIGAGVARISPKDFTDSNGQTIKYLNPPDSTEVVVPTIPGGQKANWNGTSWDLVAIVNNFTVINTSVRLEKAKLFEEVTATFSELLSVSLVDPQDDFESNTAKDIKFDGVTDIAANITSLNSLISAHNFDTSKRDSIKDERKTKFVVADEVVNRHRDQLDSISYGDNVEKLGAGVVCTFDTGVDKVNATAHGFGVDDVLEFTTDGTLPAELAINIYYWIVAAGANDFQVSATKSGSAINLTDTGSGTHKYHQSTKITTVKYRNWLDYKQLLRDFPVDMDPTSVVWPTVPT